MTASAEELRALPWARLIAESKSSSCDHVHSTLMKWIRDGAIATEEIGRWHDVEPVLSLFIDVDPDAERPYSSAALMDSISPDLLRSLAAIADEIPSDDVRARILDLAWMVKACDYTRVAIAVAAYIRSAEERLDPACRKAGLRQIGWHVLRHTFASHLAMRGAPLKAIQELLGHATIMMTMRYANLGPEIARDAVRLLDGLRDRGKELPKTASN